MHGWNSLSQEIRSGKGAGPKLKLGHGNLLNPFGLIGPFGTGSVLGSPRKHMDAKKGFIQKWFKLQSEETSRGEHRICLLINENKNVY